MSMALRQKIVMFSLAYLTIIQYALILGVLMYAMDRFDILQSVIFIFGSTSLVSIVISIITTRAYHQEEIPFVKVFLRLAAAHIPAISGFVISLVLFI